MRAAVLHECPGQLDVTEVAVAALGPREVLVRTVAAGLCHSDLHCMQGLLPVPVPNVLGHESAGVVAAVGADVRSVAPGDHVVACTSAACGSCEWCTVGRPHLCTAPPRRAAELGPALEERGRAVAQFAGIGGFAEEMLLPEQAVVRVSRDVPLDRAALVGCAVTTGLGAVFNTAEVRPGASVAVVGCGGIGLNIVQGAVIAGASRVIAVDVAQDKLDLACAFGATDAVDASAVDPVGAVRELTGGGVDHAFEALGRKVTAEQAFAMLRHRGLATIVGVLPAGTTIELPAMALFGERRLQGCLMGSNRFHVDIPYYLDLYLQGRLKLDELISQRIALDEINDGYAELAAGDRLARSVITFE